MKNFQLIKGNLMLLAALLTAGVTMSYKMAEKKTAATVHYYVSSDMSAGAFRNVANWSTTNNSVDCVTTEDVLPCKITVPENTSLSSILAGKSNDQVLDISEGYKPEP